MKRRLPPRLRRAAGSALRRVKAGARELRGGLTQAVQRRRQKNALAVTLVFDGATRLSWAAPEGVDALVARGPAGDARSQGSRHAFGAQGWWDLASLGQHDSWIILAEAGGTLRPVRSDEVSAGTRNVASHDGEEFAVEPRGDGIELMRRAGAGRPPYIAGLEVGIGEIEVSVGGLRRGDQVRWLTRRSGELVQPRELEGKAGSFLIDGALLPEELRRDRRSARLDLQVLREGKALPLGWGGSVVAEPRVALRFGSTRSWPSDDVSVAMRPYWNDKGFLSLELDTTHQGLPYA